MRDYVELMDGARIALRSLPQKVPYTLLTSQTHVTVVERLAESQGIKPRFHATYVNLLFAKSWRARCLTALIELIRCERLTPRRVVSDFIDPDFRDMLGDVIEIEQYGPRARNLIDAAHLPRLLFKTMAHRLFRLLGRQPKHEETVIRAWVDTTHATFPETVSSAALLVYPFAGSVRRQWRYLRECKRSKLRYSLVGIPYRIRDVARVLACWWRRDGLLCRCEQRAFETHADELLAMGTKHMFTTDEFSAASHAMHRKLSAAGVHSTNAAHGVAVYGPYVHYSHFKFFTTRQYDHYKRFGQFHTHDFVAQAKRRDDANPTSTTYEPIVVFVQGNWRRARKHYELEFEQRGLEHTVRLCKDLNLPCAIKSHPNVSAEEQTRTSRKLGVETISRLAELPPRHPIFINTVSSAYYDCLPFGPTVFLRDQLLRPDSVFGRHIREVAITELPTELERFREATHWRACYDAEFCTARADEPRAGASRPLTEAVLEHHDSERDAHG